MAFNTSLYRNCLPDLVPSLHLFPGVPQCIFYLISSLWLFSKTHMYVHVSMSVCVRLRARGQSQLSSPGKPSISREAGSCRPSWITQWVQEILLSLFLKFWDFKCMCMLGIFMWILQLELRLSLYKACTLPSEASPQPTSITPAVISHLDFSSTHGNTPLFFCLPLSTQKYHPKNFFNFLSEMSADLCKFLQWIPTSQNEKQDLKEVPCLSVLNSCWFVLTHTLHTLQGLWSCSFLCQNCQGPFICNYFPHFSPSPLH